MVDRCICRNVTFAELKQLADAGIRDIDELSRRTGCGTGCGLCIPYVRVVVVSGVTELPVMIRQQLPTQAKPDPSAP